MSPLRACRPVRTCRGLLSGCREAEDIALFRTVQGYLAHKKPPPPPGPPYGPSHMPTAGFQGEAFSYERGNPVSSQQELDFVTGCSETEDVARDEGRATGMGDAVLNGATFRARSPALSITNTTKNLQPIRP